MFVEGPKKKKITNGLFQGSVKAPEDSVYYHLDGKEVAVIQNLIPSVRSGRIGTRDFVRTPEIIGTNSLFNVSPIGKWKIYLSEPNDIFADKSVKRNLRIDSLYVDIHLATRTRI